MAIEFIPLGGCGEIGKNMNVVRCQDRIVVVDAGLSFPTEDMHGVDIVTPDATYLIERKNEIEGIVLTHGHEDHTGALPFLLKKITCPIYGSKMTLALVRNKLAEKGVKAELIEIDPAEPFQLGVFRIEPVRVTHSIPESLAIAVHTPEGTVFFTGDFKFDHTPVDGAITDWTRLARIGADGVKLLLSDSTNVERPGWGESESKVGEALFWLFNECPGRILVTSFASNIHRVQQVFEVAEVYDRKVFVLGRRMEQNVQAAIELGYIKPKPGVYTNFKRIDDYPDNEIVVVTTGSQGEPLSALTLMSQEEYSKLKLKAGDSVIIAATPIPGNESLVWRTVNRLTRLGVKVYYDRIEPVHVSGHAQQEELKLMIALTKPEYIAPVHGEPRHQLLYLELAKKMGYAAEKMFVPENGSRLVIDEQGARMAEPVHAGRLLIEEGAPDGVSETVIHHRRHMAEDGILIVTVGLSAERGGIQYGPEVIARGFDWNSETDQEAAIEVARATVNELVREEQRDWDAVRSELANALKIFCRKKLSRRPMVIPIVIEA
ncbi:MAG: ribonuclease J [Armatimonadetes bacterium]|nr:ribonuclease J [Armatimonadota bacterium]